MQKGDKIRFLDAVGGGTIVQYDAQRELVWVETDDGFDVGPIPAAKCVMDTAATSYQRKGCIGTHKQSESPAPTISSPKIVFYHPYALNMCYSLGIENHYPLQR